MQRVKSRKMTKIGPEIFTMHKIIIITIILFISGLHNINMAAFAEIPTNCILLIGGSPKDVVKQHPIEYYHPDAKVECRHNYDLILKLPANIQVPSDTSGCYLSSTNQIVVRGSWELQNTTITYDLHTGTTTNTVKHYSPVFADTTSSSVGPSQCFSCGGWLDNRPSGLGNTMLYPYAVNCYVYNSSPQKWITIASLSVGISSAASVSLGHHFYVIGGIKDLYRLRSLSLYDTQRHTWNHTGANNMNEPRSGHAAAALSDDEFITCGGDSASGVCQSCEIYNATSGKWRLAGKMTAERTYFRLVNFNDQIYAVGGMSNGNRTATETVEVYNRSDDSWTMVKPLKVRRNSFVAFAIALPPKPPTTMPTTEMPETLPLTQQHSTTTGATTKKSQMSTKWIVILSLLGVAVVIVLIAMAVLCWLWCRKKHRRADKDSKNSEDFGSKKEVFLPSSTADYQAWLKRNERQDGESVDDASTIDDSMMTDDTTATPH